MLEQIIQLIISGYEWITPLHVINQYERGVVMRLGIFNRALEPGLRLKWPFIEYIMTATSATTTTPLLSQTLTTMDGTSVVISVIVRHSISDIKTYLLSVADQDGVIMDTTQGAVKTVVNSTMFDDIHNPKIEKLMLKIAKRDLKKFGFLIQDITISDLAKIKTIRLMMQ
jgi:membrane protease subunit HflK